MALEIVFNDTDDGEGDEFEATGNFDIQVTSTGQGTIKLLRSLGTSVESSFDTFGPCKEYTGPANDFVANVNTNRYKILLIGTKTSDIKIVAVNLTEA